MRVEPFPVRNGRFVWAGGAVKETLAEYTPGGVSVYRGGYVAEVEKGLEAAIVEGWLGLVRG